MQKKERNELMELFRGLRVTDVRDGMDWNMMHNYGSMSPDIRPLYRTRAAGIAKTVRYMPYEGSIPKMTPQEYSEWVTWYYENINTYTWMNDIKQGDFIIIDQSGVNAGVMGSMNSLEGVKKGAAGYVTNGGIRDTDEIIIQKIPCWSKYIAQTMVQGRTQFDAVDIPVSVGGVIVNTGDIVIADGDGVIVVKREKAFDVAKYARKENDKDKKDRRNLYKELNMEMDDTVR